MRSSAHAGRHDAAADRHEVEDHVEAEPLVGAGDADRPLEQIFHPVHPPPHVGGIAIGRGQAQVGHQRSSWRINSVAAWRA
jgi:hypothetical protein